MEDDRNYADECGDHGGMNRDGEPCGRAAGWGTSNDTGRCRRHLGTSPDGSSHKGNTNAVTHGAYADENAYYQSVLDETLRSFVDDVFADYLEKYEQLHGEPPLGLESELFRVSVTHAKDIGLDRWAEEKPEGLKSGHPLVDEETEIVPIGEGMTETQRRYRESVVLAAQKKLSNDRRMWLKDLGLLEDPDSQQAAANRDVADALRDVLQ
jgi:hypothetical protein